MSVLNDLFQQILHSEERVRERFSRLRSINKEIQNTQMQIQDAEDEFKSLQGNLVLKKQRLAEQEEQLNTLKIRDNVLGEQRSTLEISEEKLQQQLNFVREASDSERNKFTRAVTEFIQCHDQSDNGQMTRKEMAKRKLDLLNKNKSELIQEFKVLKTQERQIMLLRQERDKLAQSEEALHTKLKEVHNTHDDISRETEALEKQKEAISRKPQDDQEFRRLSAELEAAKDGSMEGICEALTQELKELQQIYLKKELQKQKHLQQKQQNKVGYYHSKQHQRQLK